MKALKLIKNNLFIILVILAYVLLLIFIPDKATESVKNSTYYIIEMLKILPVVLVLTSLIDTWVPKQVIMKGLGENSKVKGVLLAIALGSLSAGPIYVAFPMCRMLFKKGAGIGNIVIILSTWAVVKVPMLITETKFLGIDFMSVRWVLTIISIVIMSFLVAKIVKRKDIPVSLTAEESQDSVIVIESEFCIACGICSAEMPLHFTMTDKKASVIMSDLSMGKAKEKLEMVIQKCPGNCINHKTKKY